jgi:hypothetical protein
MLVTYQVAASTGSNNLSQLANYYSPYLYEVRFTA